MARKPVKKPVKKSAPKKPKVIESGVGYACLYCGDVSASDSVFTADREATIIECEECGKELKAWVDIAFFTAKAEE